jgi:hypothetical protein
MEAVKQFVKGLTTEEVEKKATGSPYHFRYSEYGNLYMLSYTDKSDMEDSLVRSMNGVIFEKKTNKIIHYSFQKAYEGFNEKDEKDTYKNTKPEEFDIEISTEGTHVKVHFYDDKWNVSTSRSITCALVKGNSDISFLEMFKECCEYENIDIEKLDKQFCYSFVIQHPANRICYEINTPYCGMLNYVDIENNKIYRTTLGFKVDDTIENIEKFSKTPESYQNFIVYFGENIRVKITSLNFKLLKKIIKNDKKMERIYLRSIKEYIPGLMEKFFSNYMDTFDYVNHRLEEVVNTVHKIYMNIYIHKKETEIPERYKRTIGQLHGFHRKTREKITKQVIYNHIMNLSENIVMWILEI